jgi:hypothetical protein
MSLRSGSPTFGTPEPAIGSMVVGQLARRLGLPLRCAGSFTTSKLPDGQAMQESVMSMLSAVHCGANFILHSAGFLDGLLSMSYEKFMMDADFCGALHSYLGGVKVDDNTLAMGAFHEVGPAAISWAAPTPWPTTPPPSSTPPSPTTRPSKPGRRPARPTAPPVPTSAGRPRWPSTSRRRSTRAWTNRSATSSSARRPR